MSLYSNVIVFTVATHGNGQIDLCGIWRGPTALRYGVFDRTDPTHTTVEEFASYNEALACFHHYTGE